MTDFRIETDPAFMTPYERTIYFAGRRYALHYHRTMREKIPPARWLAFMTAPEARAVHYVGNEAVAGIWLAGYNLQATANAEA